MDPTLDKLKFVGKCLVSGLVVAWLVWFVPFDDLVDRSGAALGGDYVMLYTAGQVMSAGQAELLYDDAANQRRTNALFPAMGPRASWPYRYPPVVAWAMVPLAQLPYLPSYATFLALSILVWALVLRSLLRQGNRTDSQRRALMWAAIGWPVALEVFLGGQASMLALGILVATASLLRRGRPFWAGMVLGLALYKPNVLALLAIGVFVRYPRCILGAAMTALVLGVASWWAVGVEGIVTYVRLATQLSTASWDLETPFWKVHGLSPWITATVGDSGRAITTGIGVLVAIAVSLRAKSRAARLTTWLATLVVVNALFNPYVPIYDLVLLAPAAFWCFGEDDRLGEPRRAGQPWLLELTVFALYFGPHLSQAVCKATQCSLQPFALLLVGALCLYQVRAGRSSSGEIQPGTGGNRQRATRNASSVVA